ncbi:MAG TPA: DUF1579 family protein [Propionibacteriaceae bacterium]|jgi:Protein of unknown function (DUF1579)|nr:DUF1579 family protein [Propionibacteriaceae bacterium]
MLLPDSEGTWTGTNGFRLMPADPLAEFPARATVSHAAGGHLVSIAYWWEHPDDGPQDGFMVIGLADEGGSLVAMWGDSWHQKPTPMMFSGSRGTGGALELEGDYGGGWRWRVTFDATDTDNFRMQMDNVIPAEYATAEKSAGPYPVMLMQTRRA